MWEIKGTKVDTEIVEFDVDEVLCEYDGLGTFTFTNSNDQLCLGHWLDDGDKVDRFLVAAISDVILADLKSGKLGLWESLNQESTWIFDMSYEGKVTQCYSVKFDDVPNDCMPDRKVKLWVHLEKENE